MTLHIPFDQGAVQAKLAANHTFIAENYDDSGTLLTVELSQLELEKFKKYIICFKNIYCLLVIFFRDDEI